MKETECTFFSASGRTAGPEELFFDIETTGLSPDRAIVYLIGCAWYAGGCWHLKQWFADTREAEKDLLRAFSDHCSRFRALVHFNGDGFDLPFLMRRFGHHHLTPAFSSLESRDLYRAVRPLKKLLGLGDLKLKSLERFLGIEREDPFTGGQLIEIYDHYLGTRDPKLEHFLMLHNEEDIKGMPELLPLLDFPDWQSGTFSLLQMTREPFRRLDGTKAEEAFLTFTGEYPVPRAFTSHHPSGAVLAVRECRVTLRLPLFEGTLFHYYPNYRDYYYLPLEHRAVHKSVGEFVDKRYREKATPANCCVSRNGIFLPLPDACLEPNFRTDPKSREIYLEWDEARFSSAEAATAFLQGWLRRFQSGK